MEGNDRDLQGNWREDLLVAIIRRRIMKESVWSILWKAWKCCAVHCKLFIFRYFIYWITVLSYTLLYCHALYCTVIDFTVLSCSLLYFHILYLAVLHSTVLYCHTLNCTVIQSTVSCYTLQESKRHREREIEGERHNK